MQHRLAEAMNAHDVDRLTALFADDYRSESPPHPSRAFVGRSQVVENWTSVFAGVPDFTAVLVESTLDGSTEWGEWAWQGRHRDGSAFAMAGVIVIEVCDDKIVAGRLFMERVDPADGADIDQAVRELYSPDG